MKNIKLKNLRRDASTYVKNAGTKNLLLVAKNKATKKRHVLAGELSEALILDIFRFDGSKSRLKNSFNVYNSLVNNFNFTDLGYKYNENELTAIEGLNRGQVVEKLVCTDLNGTQTKYADAFTEGGDIIVNGVHYQVKTHDATLASPSLLRKLEQ